MSCLSQQENIVKILHVFIVIEQNLVFVLVIPENCHYQGIFKFGPMRPPGQYFKLYEILTRHYRMISGVQSNFFRLEDDVIMGREKYDFIIGTVFYL